MLLFFGTGFLLTLFSYLIIIFAIIGFITTIKWFVKRGKKKR